MKYFIMSSVAIVSLCLMPGCSTTDNPLGFSGESENDGPVRPLTLEWQFPEGQNALYYPPGQVTKSELEVTELVTVEHGGRLKADFEYTTTTNKRIHVKAEFRVPDGAVAKNVLITMTLDTAMVAIRFQPEGLVFLEPALLDLHVSHLNQIPDDWTLEFVHVDEAGNTSPSTYEALDVNRHPDHTDIHLKKASISHFNIDHFSIYAFGR